MSVQGSHDDMSAIDLKSTKPVESLNAKSEVNANSKPQEHAPESKSARLNWFEKVYHPPASALDGEKCRVQPRPGQIAYLEAGKVTRGCDYKTFAEPKAPGSAGYKHARTDGRIDIPALFREEKAKSVYIEEKERERHHKKDSYFNASGVIVGKRGDDELLILTDNHVVGGDRGSKLKEVKVRTPDGVAHPGRVVDRTPTEDLALVAIKIDPKQMSNFEVATAVKSLSQVHIGDKVLGLGYPEDSGYLYASPGTVKQIAPENDLTGCDINACYAEDWNRPMINAWMNTKSGNSGGGNWNARGELIGLLSGSPGNSIKYSLLTSVTQDGIDNMIRRAKAW